MSKCSVLILVVSIALSGPATARGSEGAVVDSFAEYEAWMSVLAEFTQGVEFDEKDLQNFLQYWPEMSSLEVMAEDDDADSAKEFSRDVREVLADPEYQAWARGNDLDPENWLRKSTRISTVLMAQQIESQREMMASQRQSYLAMVEESCAQVDEETCQQMRAGMKESMAASEAIMDAIAKLPPATASEAALLEQYGSDLESVLMADDEEDYGDYDSDYDEDYDDYDEDDG